MNNTPTQAEKAQIFKSLHERAGCFVIPNPGDAGMAKILASLGFEALATTSAGFAFALGQPDGTAVVTLESTLANAKQIVDATSLPVSCDMQNGFSATATGLADTIEKASAVGLVSCSIEDASGDTNHPIYDISEATERITAAVEAAHKLSFPFLITGRAENYLHGNADLKDTIKRLQHYQEAGADVLFAPGLSSKQDIASVLKEIDRPLNAIMPMGNMTVGEMAELGVKRISVGSTLSRVALSAVKKAATEIMEKGTFQFVEGTMPYSFFNNMFKA